MLQRGRKPVLTAVAVLPGSAERMERVKPPPELRGIERDIWNTVVEAEPADWFSPSNLPLLVQYCRHVAQSHILAELLAGTTTGGLSYKELLALQVNETKIIADLATKMRLSQKSTVNDRGNVKKKSAAKQPWED